jgi:hypothetical protein
MDFLSQHGTLLISCFVGTWWLRKYFRRRAANPHGLPYPPGPKGYPIIGNLFDLPTDKPWLVYDEMHKKYGQSKYGPYIPYQSSECSTGDMVYLNVMGQGFLILGSWERTNDLFEKRGSIYSDRIHSPLILDL